jgi:hypothetical protein
MRPTPPAFPRSRRRPALAFLAVAATAMMAAGCGGNSPSSASLSGAAAAKSGADPAFQFSACMRHHGVTNFPDPKVKTSGGSTQVAIGINPSISGQPAFNTAQKACQHILGNPHNSGPDSSPAQQRARTQALIAFARCLRTHGFPNFPDPNANGDLSPDTIRKAGINLQTPALLTAGQGCASVTHGMITPAQVAQAINHAKASATGSGGGG